MKTLNFKLRPLILVLVVALLGGGATSPVYEGLGKIASGNTVEARREAVGELMRAAMRDAVASKVNPSRFASFETLLEETLISRYNEFVRNFRVEKESAVGAVYKVRARVDLDQTRLEKELKQHGFADSGAEPPRVALFFAEQSKDKKTIQAWWQPDFKGKNTLQNSFLKSFSTLPVQFVDVSRLLRSKDAETQELVARLREMDTQFNQDLLLELGVALNAHYVAFGVLRQGFEAANMLVYRVNDRGRVGQLRFQEEDKKTKVTPLASLTFQFSGVVLRDWLEQWFGDQSVILAFENIDGLKTYSKIVEELKKIDAISSFYERRFQGKGIEVAVVSNLRMEQLKAKLLTRSWLQKTFEWKTVNDRRLVASKR